MFLYHWFSHFIIQIDAPFDEVEMFQLRDTAANVPRLFETKVLEVWCVIKQVMRKCLITGDYDNSLAYVH